MRIWICSIREQFSILQSLHLLMHNFMRETLCECRKPHPDEPSYIWIHKMHRYTHFEHLRAMLFYHVMSCIQHLVLQPSLLFQITLCYFTITHKLQYFWCSLLQANFKSLSRYNAIIFVVCVHLLIILDRKNGITAFY